MNFEIRQRCGTCSPSKQNETRFACQLPTMGSTCLHWSLTGVVATWSLGENHPTLWLVQVW